MPLTDNTDPAYRAGMEALAELPAAPHNRTALWRDAELLARSDGASSVSSAHLREALALQHSARQVIAKERGWSPERFRTRQSDGVHCADSLGA